MKNKIVSILAAGSLAASLLTGVVPMTVMADGTMVVSVGADLTEEQKTAVLKYFGVYGNNGVQMITVTNQDERNHLSSYIPIEQIGSRTISCALVKPTASGGVQVKTANLDYITSNMIASNLVTCGVTNCQAIAAAPFEVSGTGALTGILMAYENATGSQISQQTKDLSAQEIQITENLSAKADNQQVAQQIVNDVKLQVLDSAVDTLELTEVQDNSDNSDNSVDNSVDNSQVSNIVNNVVNNYATTNNGVQLTDEDVKSLTDYATQLAKQAYEQGVEAGKAQLQAQAQIQQNIEGQTGVTSSETTSTIVDQAASQAQASEPTAEASPEPVPSETPATDAGAQDGNIFSNTDASALNGGDTSSTLVTGTDESVIANDAAQGATDNDALITDQSGTSEESSEGQTASTDPSGLVITANDSNSTDAAPDDGQTQTGAEEAAVPAAAETLTADQADVSYLNQDGVSHLPAFTLALKKDNLVPVSGTLAVADGSGNLLGTADLSDKDQTAAISSGSQNESFKTDLGWDQLTGLIFQVKDSSGALVLPQAGQTYQLTLNGTFAQTPDPAQTDGAPVVAADIQNLTYTAAADTGMGLSLDGVKLSDLTAGGNVTGSVRIDGSLYASASVSSPDEMISVNTLDGTGVVSASGDTSVTISLASAGLAEIDLSYTPAGSAGASEAGAEEAALDGTADGTADGASLDGEQVSADDASSDGVNPASAEPVLVRYFIPVQGQIQ